MLKAKLSILIAVFLSICAFAQSADEIIKNNLARSGGENAWNNLNSIILKGEANINVDYSYPIIIQHQRPYNKKVSFIIDGKEVLNEGYDGKNGWTYSEIQKKNVVVPNYIPDAFDSDLLKYKQKGFKLNYIGKETYEKGKQCHRIELLKNKNQSFYCFDDKTYAVVYEENKDEVLYYHDYKTFNGLSFATRIVGKPKEGGEYVIKFNTIQINPPIDKKVFKF